MSESIKRLREIEYKKGYSQAKADAMNAIGECIAQIADEDFPNKKEYLTALIHFRSAIRAKLEKKEEEMK